MVEIVDNRASTSFVDSLKPGDEVTVLLSDRSFLPGRSYVLTDFIGGTKNG